MNNNEQSQSNDKKTKGGGFPAVDLSESLAMIKKGSSAGWEMSRDTFAGAIGSSSNSGTFLSKLAALRDFGLVERGDRIRFTALAKTLILPTDTATIQSDLQRAFFNCDVFKTIYEKIRDTSGESNIETVANMAAHDFRVAVKRKGVFATNFAASAQFAGLLSVEGTRIVIKKAENPQTTNTANANNDQAAKEDVKYSFEFKDAGRGWNLVIRSEAPLSTPSRKKIIELIELLEPAEG